MPMHVLVTVHSVTEVLAKVAGQESWEKEDTRISVEGYKWFGKPRSNQNSQRDVVVHPVQCTYIYIYIHICALLTWVKCHDNTFRDEILKYGEEETQDESTAAKQGHASEESDGEPVVEVDDTELRLGPPGPPYGIVINGASLVSKPLT